MNKTVLAVLGLLVGGLIILALIAAGSYNRFVGLSQGVNQQWAQVQTVYQRRADLIPNLVKTVEGAANFEKTTLNEITQARASVGQVNFGTAPTNPEDLQKFQQAQDHLSSALSRLLVVSERYPELKANANFQSLQSQIEGTENRISVERQKFNDTVGQYNTAVQRFPGVIFAGLFHFQPKPFFTATEGAATPPKVEFNFSPNANKPK